MSVEEIRERVKEMLLMGNAHDKMLDGYIVEVLDFAKSAGVPDAVLNSERIIGLAARGVTDLWNYGAGDGKLSEYFKMRCIQLTE
jgi:hypothetical protein